MKFGYFQQNNNSNTVHDTKRKTEVGNLKKNPDESLRRISKEDNLNYPCKHF